MYGLTRAGYANLIWSAAGCATAALAIALRYYCKYLTRAGFSQDDAWIFIATVLYWIGMGVNLWGTWTGGSGRETHELLFPYSEQFAGPVEIGNFPLVERYLLTRLVAFYMTVLAGYAVKMAILFFYRRIFDARRYHILNYVVMGVATAWLVGTVVAGFTICRPLNVFWQPWLVLLGQGNCYNYGSYFLGTGISDTIIDILILALPLHTVWIIKLPIKQKLVISGMFALGSFAVITNGLRVWVIFQPDQPLVRFAEAEIWTNIHTTAAILCACLPLYKPLFGAMFSMMGGTTKKGLTDNRPMSEKMRGPTKDNGHLESGAGLMQNANRPGTAGSLLMDAPRPTTALSGSTLAPSRPTTAKSLSPAELKDRELPPLPQGPREIVLSRNGKSFEIEHPHMPKSATSTRFNQFPQRSVSNKEFGSNHPSEEDVPDVPQTLPQRSFSNKEFGQAYPSRENTPDLPPMPQHSQMGQANHIHAQAHLSVQAQMPPQAHVPHSRQDSHDTQGTSHSQAAHSRQVLQESEMQIGAPRQGAIHRVPTGRALRRLPSMQQLPPQPPPPSHLTPIPDIPRRSVTPQPARVTEPLQLPARAKTPQPISPILLQPATYQPPTTNKPAAQLNPQQFRPTPQQYQTPQLRSQQHSRPTVSQWERPRDGSPHAFRPGPHQFHEPPAVPPAQPLPQQQTPRQTQIPPPTMAPYPTTPTFDSPERYERVEEPPYPMELDEEIVHGLRVPVPLDASGEKTAPYPRHSLTPLPLHVKKASTSTLPTLSANIYQPPVRQQTLRVQQRVMTMPPTPGSPFDMG